MSECEHITMVRVMKEVVDPRSRRGMSYEWTYLLELIAGAMLSGRRTVVEIGAWVQENRQGLIAMLQPAKQRVPSLSTLRRALARVGIEALEAALGRYQGELDNEVGEDEESGVMTTLQGTTLKLASVDGKVVRGASAHGKQIWLVGFVRHGLGLVLDQMQTDVRKQERKVAQTLLARNLLKGYVVTLDALHTCPQQAEQIWLRGGDYLMVVKGNRRTMHQDLVDTFALFPPQNAAEEKFWEYEFDIVRYCGHGRQELVIVESTPRLNGETLLPAANLVVRRTRIVLYTHSKRQSVDREYLVTSLSRQQVTLAQIERIRRGHWTIENKTHYVRDVTFGEDRCQVRSGNAPQALAAFRNAITALLRTEGWPCIPPGFRYYAASLQKTLQTIGAIAT